MGVHVWDSNDLIYMLPMKSCLKINYCYETAQFDLYGIHYVTN